MLTVVDDELAALVEQEQALADRTRRSSNASLPRQMRQARRCASGACIRIHAAQ
jgi:hypothetical protein